MCVRETVGQGEERKKYIYIYMHVCIYIHTCAHTYVHTYIYVHIQIQTHTSQVKYLELNGKFSTYSEVRSHSQVN